MPKSCSFTKRPRFNSQNLAAVAIQHVSRRPAKSEPVVWRCLFCGGWHYRFDAIKGK